MNTEREKIELNKAIELKAEIEKIPYGDMKQEFEKMGIGEIFKPGTKKDVLVSMALVALEKKNIDETVVIEPVIVEPTIEPNGETTEVLLKSIVDAVVPSVFSELAPSITELEKANTENGASESNDVEKLPTEPFYTREILEENLTIISLQLKDCQFEHKKSIIDKQNEILAHLDNLDLWESRQ